MLVISKLFRPKYTVMNMENTISNRINLKCAKRFIKTLSKTKQTELAFDLSLPKNLGKKYFKSNNAT